MESIGDKLRTNREERGYSIEQVARDTHITKRYLEALEEENFTIFPGESYLLGFLRNYSNYLGLNEGEMVTLYKNMQLQENPSPVEELLYPKSRPWGKIIFILAFILIVAGGIAAVLLLNDSDAPEPQPIQGVQAPATGDQGRTIAFTGEILEQLFSEGDQIRVSLENLEQTILLETITDQEIFFSSPGGDFRLATMDAALIDLNRDGEDDIRIQTKGNTAQEGDSPQSVIRIDRFIQLPSDAPSDLLAEQQTGTEFLPGSNPPEDAPNLGRTTLPGRVQSSRTILEQPSPSAIRLIARPSAPVLIRTMDDQGRTQERYLEDGDILESSAAQWIRIWTSNAGASGIDVNGQAVRLGTSGEPTAAMIAWNQTQGSQANRLELIPMY